MPAPIVETLPISPARLSRPNNFVSESVVFLEALPAFRTQVNQLATYINANIPNKWNFGKLNGVRSFPVISQTSTYDIEYTGNSINFTSSLDVFYDVLHAHSTRLNAASSWFDSVLDEVGTAPYDLDKPMISGVTIPMTRTQGREDFNKRALYFGESCTNNINSLYQTIWYTHLVCCGDKDYGLITDTVTETVDFNPFEPPYNLVGIWNDTTQAVDLTWDFNE